MPMETAARPARAQPAAAGAAAAACSRTTCFIERFFARHEATLTRAAGRGLQALMDLPDNDLLDLLLARTRARRRARPPRRCARCWRRCGATPTRGDGRVNHATRNAMMTPSDVKATLSFSDGSPSMELPIYKGIDRPGRDRHPQALRADRQVHLRPGLPVDRVVQLDHHLHRRRQGRAAVPRLPDRAARGATATSSTPATCC